jgi:hypothetical protein
LSLVAITALRNKLVLKKARLFSRTKTEQQCASTEMMRV